MKKIGFVDIALAFLSLFLCLGTAFLFHPCGPKADGSWMLCHWAGNMIVALGAAFSAASVARLFFPKDIKVGFSIAFIPFSIVTILVPGVLVRMCGMKDMRCWTATRPAALILAGAICALSVADIIFSAKKK